MSDDIKLTGYSEDSEIKRYIQNTMMPRVFHDIPINVLNTGSFSIISEYMSQALENLAFTSSFYFNESFITKAVLADSIYSEAAIFNIGYAYATPSSCNFLLELKIEDIINNATRNEESGLMEFILDKDTQFNLSNGNVYSLDYDICISYMDIQTATGSDRAWDVHYVMDNAQNSIAINKNSYIMHRVTSVWLCLMINASEITREVHTVVNTTSNGMPNADTVITCINHICGFDIKYIDSESKKTGIPKYIASDHVLPIHSNVKDANPYVNYIMDDSQTIRFMWQLAGSKYFTPEVNSSFEITIYTCHGAAANFTAFNNTDQPYVISSTKNYPNNGNVMKAGFVISGSMGGADIGNAETVRRQTIEAYNTANQIASDHDLDEYFKTFYFKNALFPFFFKRRDDPWGRIWSGSVALKDDDDYIFKTNTLHGQIPYDVLYRNTDNGEQENEIIIPPGWVWKYKEGYTEDALYTVEPYLQGDSIRVELADSFSDTSGNFAFVNPFGMRIQKDPFAIGYFNPWINETVTAKAITTRKRSDDFGSDSAEIYHAFPILTNIQRTYLENFYKMTSYVVPTITTMNGKDLVSYMKDTSSIPTLSDYLWKYFKKPTDLYASAIPMVGLTENDRYLPFDPENTYICIAAKNVNEDNTMVTFDDFWILDYSAGMDNGKKVTFDIHSGTSFTLTGNSSLWNSDVCEPIYLDADSTITCTFSDTDTANDLSSKYLIFERADSNRYYTLKIKDPGENTDEDVDLTGCITRIVVDSAAKADMTKYGETVLYSINKPGIPNSSVTIFFNDGTGETSCTIHNSARIYIPYDVDIEPETVNGKRVFNFENATAGTILMYVEMKAIASLGALDYYRIKFANVGINEPMFFINNNILNYDKNNMRVVLQAMLNGVETGRIEMTPVSLESDGSYKFETSIYPLNQLVDIDNRISIASIDNGGGLWKQMTESNVLVDATSPEFKMTILIKSDHYDKECALGSDYTGYVIADEYQLEDVELIQELKEMRSVVRFSDTSQPTSAELGLYNKMLDLIRPLDRKDNIFDIIMYAEDALEGKVSGSPAHIKSIAGDMSIELAECIADASRIFTENSRKMPDGAIDNLNTIKSDLDFISSWNGLYSVGTQNDSNIEKVFVMADTDGSLIMYSDPTCSSRVLPVLNVIYYDNYLGANKAFVKGEGYDIVEIQLIIWEDQINLLNKYGTYVENLFQFVNIHSGLTVQLMPFTDVSLINSERFTSFITAFTQVHKAMEPVINHRLDGNNYLDCKLVATYGKPHSYTTEFHKEINDEVYWPDLSIEMEFDIALKNQSIATDTLDKLRGIIKSYFAKITNVHTAQERLTKDNNIYISELLRLMLNEKSDNVEYLKFVGWYTSERNNPKSTKFMDANTQSIIQKWQNIDNFPTTKLESFVPEMFTIENANIKFNIL